MINAKIKTLLLDKEKKGVEITVRGENVDISVIISVREAIEFYNHYKWLVEKRLDEICPGGKIPDDIPSYIRIIYADKEDGGKFENLQIRKSYPSGIVERYE